MDFLATSTSLGTLEVLEVYVQFNGPRLLACKNQAEKIFLALWVDEEEDFDLWLYMMVSIDRLQSIRTGRISLYEAFSNPELNYFHEAIFTHAENAWSTREVALDGIDEDCLPSQKAFLDFDPKTLPQVKAQKASWTALKKEREIVYLVLEPESEYPNEISSLALGKVLFTFQPLLNQFKLLSCEDLELRPKDIARKSEFNVFSTSPGSFQIELASALFEVDVFGNSFAGDAIDMLFQLIQLGSDAKLLQNFMSHMDKKTAIKYRLFLEALVGSGTGVKFEWGSPTLIRGGIVEANLSSVSEILKIIKKIESLQDREIKIIGELFKMDKIGWKFGIKDIKTDDLYSGDILDQAKDEARIAKISDLYSATILVISEITPATNSIKPYYKLIDLNPYEPSEKQMEITAAI
jgi:hypothetical protein